MKQLKQLQLVDISHCSVGDEGAIAVADAIKQSAVTFFAAVQIAWSCRVSLVSKVCFPTFSRMDVRSKIFRRTGARVDKLFWERHGE